MATVYRVQATWSGFTGSPGYSRFSFQSLTDATTRDAAGASVRTFFDAIKALLPYGVNIQVGAAIDEFDMATGELTGASSMTAAPAIVSSTAPSQAYPAGSGYVASWNTSLIFNGHRVKGRTFIVPASIVCFETDGSLTSAAIATTVAAGNALASNINFSVWSRQYSKTPPITQINGALALVDTCSVKDSASQLRTRRT